MRTAKNQKPLVSVIMPARDAGLFLLEALKSIQNQTLDNWELIVVEDASLDNTYKILKSLAKVDKRIRIIRNKERLGPSKSSNIAISKARGKFIARMDADDISLPWRLENQVKFLQENPKAVATGGQCIVINKEGKRIGDKKFPTEPLVIRKMIFAAAPLQQPTLMVNKRHLPKDFSWYQDALEIAEEIDLLFRLFKYGEVHNLKDIVLKYRIHGGNTSLKDPKKTFLLTLKTRLKGVIEYGYRPNLKGIFFTLLQILIVVLLPKRLIYPIYTLVRGVRRLRVPNFKLGIIQTGVKNA